jgi:two-component system response regulator HydG
MHRKRLLFVDDEPAIRETLSIILSRYGFSVSVAATVSQALEFIAKQEFDILLCDLNVEREADGYDVIRAMQAANPRCATLILTGYPTVDTAVEGIRLHIDDYLIKPTNADALVALLAEKLAAGQAKPTDSVTART